MLMFIPHEQATKVGKGAWGCHPFVIAAGEENEPT